MNEANDIEHEWEICKNNISKIANECCGMYVAENRRKKTEWWNDEIKSTVEEKRVKWISWMQDRSEDYLRDYREQNRRTSMLQSIKFYKYMEFPYRLKSWGQRKWLLGLKKRGRLIWSGSWKHVSKSFHLIPDWNWCMVEYAVMQMVPFDIKEIPSTDGISSPPEVVQKNWLQWSMIECALNSRTSWANWTSFAPIWRQRRTYAQVFQRCIFNQEYLSLWTQNDLIVYIVRSAWKDRNVNFKFRNVVSSS